MLASTIDNSPATPPARNRGGRPKGATKSRLTKEQLEALLAVRLKDKDIPVQYLSAISSTFASLKGWSRNVTDDAKLDMGAFLRGWARERVYPSVDTEVAAGARSSIVGQPGACGVQTETGEIPQRESQTEPLMPSHTTIPPENSPQVVESKDDISKS